MSPEQVRGDALTYQSDMFSLGTVLYHLLAGKLPFKVDRSVLIRLIVEMSDLTSKENIDKLSTKLISRSISQLTG
jgi:serine/threonine-protein kinase